MTSTTSVSPWKAAAMLAALGICATSCRTAAPVVVIDPPPTTSTPHWPGVDTTIALIANALADRALVPPALQAQGRSETRRAISLALLADSLLGPTGVFALATGPDTSSASGRRTAIDAFNAGAEAVEASAEATNLQAAGEMLEEAAAAFRAALEANPFDEDAYYWLSRVLQAQASAMEEAGAVRSAINVARRLVSMHNHRHDYIAILAEAHERRPSGEGGMDAAALWSRAAQATMDDAHFNGAPLDSATVFIYHTRSSRAFIAAKEGARALSALERAAPFAATPEEHTYVQAEQQWIGWDSATIGTRIRFDSLQAMAATHPAASVDGLRRLAAVVSTRRAYVEVQHENSPCYSTR